MLFVKSSSDYTSTDVTRQETSSFQVPVAQSSFNIQSSVSASTIPEHCTDIEQKFYILSEKLRECRRQNINKSPIEILHMALDKVKMTQLCTFKNLPNLKANMPQFSCILEIDFVYICSGVSTNKKAAKHITFDNAVAMLVKPYFSVDESEHGVMELKSSDTPCDANVTPETDIKYETKPDKFIGPHTESNKNHLKRPHSVMFNIEQFLIQEHINSDNPVSILRTSADFNRNLLEFDFTEASLGDTRVRCRLMLEDYVLSDVIDVNKAMAKTKAAESALDYLRSQCWTIRIKQNEDSEGDRLTRDEILGDIQQQSDKIGDSNIGSQLLKKMGWSGGGLGKKESGIEEPVGLNSLIIDRQGLGLQATHGITGTFMQTIKKMLSDYVKSHDPNDLAFSQEFSKEERAVIHKESRKLGLKSGSKGKDESRYLIVSRKRTPSQLFQHVLQSGGCTNKYELVPPIT